MNLDRFERFVNIGTDANRLPSVAFAAVRICATMVDAEIRDISLSQRICKRAAKKLRAASPFNKARADQTEAQATDLEDVRKTSFRLRESLGRMLIDIGKELDRTLSFDQICDLLEVNSLEREEIRSTNLTEDRDFMIIASVFGYDHSATYRAPDHVRRDGVVYWSIQWEIMRVMFDTPEGRKASDEVWQKALEPGGPLYGMPTYYQDADGSMVRKSPDLIVHDADGNHVVKRAIGR